MNVIDKCSDPSKQLSSNFRDYVVSKPLGSGTFGRVNLMEYVPTGGEYAVKFFNSSQLNITKFGSFRSALFSDSGEIRQEIDFLLQHRHPNIIEAYKVLLVDHTSYMGTEVNLVLVMELGTMDLTRRFEQPMSPDLKISFMHQLLSGLEYIDRRGFVHCDMKADNILVKGDTLKIGDMGLLLHKDTFLTIPGSKFCNPVLTRAPELLFLSALRFVESSIDQKRRDEIVSWIDDYSHFIDSERPSYRSGFVSYEEVRTGEFFSLGKMFLEIYQGKVIDEVYDAYYKTFYLSLLNPQERIVKLKEYLKEEIPGADAMIASLLEGDPKKRRTCFREILKSPVFNFNQYRSFTKGFVIRPVVLDEVNYSEIQAEIENAVQRIIIACRTQDLKFYHLFKALALFRDTLSFGIKYPTEGDVQNKLFDLALCCLVLSVGRKLISHSKNALQDNRKYFSTPGSSSDTSLAKFFFDLYRHTQGVVLRDSTFDHASNGTIALKSILYYTQPEIFTACTPTEYVFRLEKETEYTEKRHPLTSNISTPIYKELFEIMKSVAKVVETSTSLETPKR